MYVNAYTAQKLSAAEQAQLVRDVERRRIVAARTRRTPGTPPEPPLSGRTLTELIPRFANARLRTL